MLALYLAMRLGLPRPFWAPMTAYLVSQPLAGAVRSKAVYRLSGTVLGSIMAVVLVPPLVNYSVLLTLAVALWIGLCLYISLLDRTPRSYTFILAGYTVGFIAFPALMDTSTFNAATMFEVALARVEEIALGITCATLLHTLVFPQSIGPVLLRRLDKTIDDAVQWVNHALLGTDAARSAGDYKKLAQDITELRMMATHLPFDTSNLRWTANAIRILQDRLAIMMPLLSAIEDRIRLLRPAGTGALSPEWQTLLSDIVAWAQRGTTVSSNTTAAELIVLRQRIAARAPSIDGRASWQQILEINLVGELNKLLSACESCLDLRRQIEAGLGGTLSTPTQELTAIPTRELHTDRGLALMSSFAAVAAVCASCAFWVITGWPAGSAAPMMAGVFCTFFATQDDPVPSLKMAFFYNTVWSVPFAAVYLLWLLPSAHSFEMLMLVMAPFLLVFGVLFARPPLAARAFTLMIAVLATLTLNDTGTPDMITFLNSQISQGVGFGAAVLFTQLFRSVDGQWTARRLLLAGWDEIARMGQAIKPPAVIAVTIRMVDRIGLLAARLGAGTGKQEAAGNALDDLRIGLGMTYLMRLQPRLQRHAVSLQALLQALSTHFANRPAQPTARPATLLAQIDYSLGQVCAIPPSIQQHKAISALAGIRRDLFPDAPPYQSREPQGKVSA